jgi:hypothetical protein
MALLLPKSIFFHIPRTGGTWLTSLLKENMICSNISTKHMPPHKVKKEIGNRFKFSFVRNPVHWYISRFTSETHIHRILSGKIGTLTKYQPTFQLDALSMEESFCPWLERNLSERPGWLNWYYHWFLGEKYQNVDFIGKYENQMEDIKKIFQLSGDTYPDIQAKSSSRPQRNILKSHCSYTVDLLKKVIEQERAVFQYFNYSTKLEDYLYLTK